MRTHTVRSLCRISLSLALLGILILAPLALADTPVDNVTSQQITGGPVVMYTDANTGSKELMTLKDGEIVGLEHNLYMDPNWVKVHAWDYESKKFRIGWIATGHFATIDPNGENFRVIGEVVSRTVTLREGPSTSAGKLATINQGQSFVFIRSEGEWTYVQFTDGKTNLTHEGYVRSELIVEKAEHLVCSSGDIPAYAYPSFDSKVVSYLSSDTRMTIIGETDDFWVVSLRTAAASIPKDADVYVEER